MLVPFSPPTVLDNNSLLPPLQIHPVPHSPSSSPSSDEMLHLPFLPHPKTPSFNVRISDPSPPPVSHEYSLDRDFSPSRKRDLQVYDHEATVIDTFAPGTSLYDSSPASSVSSEDHSVSASNFGRCSLEMFIATKSRVIRVSGETLSSIPRPC